MDSLLKKLLGRDIPEELLFIEDLPSSDWVLDRGGALERSPEKDHISIRFVQRDEGGKLAIYGECHVHAGSASCNQRPVEEWVESVDGEANALNWGDNSSEHYDSFPARIWREVNGL